MQVEPRLRIAQSEKKDVSDAGLQEKAEDYFKGVISSILKLSKERIDATAPMENYGIDSILIVQMTSALEKVFGPLSKTLFFEYQNIRDLTGYFLLSHTQPLIEQLGVNKKPLSLPSKSTKISLHSRKRSRYLKHDLKEQAEIAIIGMSGRYPQAENLAVFWKNLQEGKDCITEIPKERWNHSIYFDADKNKAGKTYSKWGGFIEDVDAFDPLFFHISPKDAELIDPQERLFLQCVYETLEDAGYTKETLDRTMGVYVGVMYEEYQLYGAQEQERGWMVALGGNPSSIANRVSYFFNFHGPSIALDTMCSSSLTALHLACESLKLKECAVAIAGGVNLSIHPNKYLMLGQGKFVSSKGRCESFGVGGDGYVPGEGIGAVLLKPLSKAIADHDHIYGIIKGTAVNHGGKTNGYSVPNPHAQADAIKKALKEAKVDPRTISYIEAHGTGTSLGDPIEMTGLSKAFQEYTNDKQFCSLGSAKSNIGHCESAAGIAGLTKILLQMKHQQLVPSLHSQQLNPHIDFGATPFIVQQQLQEWIRPVLNGKEYPRIAGLSGFGAGGSNAHILIEEYIPKEPSNRELDIPFIIVLSAQSKAQLQLQAKRLAQGISEQNYCDADLLAIAYTLQIGREPMAERLALIVQHIKELQEKLLAFAEGETPIEGLLLGQIKQDKDVLEVFAHDEDMGKTIEVWIEKRKVQKILELWVKGLNVDWNKFYGEEKPKRMSLPTYPFAKERYWIKENTSKTHLQASATSDLHPLLHHNTSDLLEQKYSSRYTGEEFFLADHIVKGKKVLPGVAHLELARAAIERGMREKRGFKLTNVIWITPLTVENQFLDIHIGLYPEEEGSIFYEIYSESEVVFSQGSAKLCQNKEAPFLDLEELKKNCQGQTFTKEECYKAFKKIGIDYGTAFQGIDVIYASKSQLLAKISLPSSLNNTIDQFVLHPSMMDAAFHASIGFSLHLDPEENFKLSLPFAMEELEILAPFAPTMWSFIQSRENENRTISKYDIDVCDEKRKNLCADEGSDHQISRRKINLKTFHENLVKLL